MNVIEYSSNYNHSQFQREIEYCIKYNEIYFTTKISAII